MSSVRFFTSAALRPHEEVDGEIVPWLPRWITVEYEGDQPRTGVWQSAGGRRRVCWYRGGPEVDLSAMHQERYGEEPYWVVTLGRRIAVDEYDGHGTLLGHRRWDFDQRGMPVAEEELGPDGAVRVRRRYECFKSGFVIEQHEERPPAFKSVELPRQRAMSHPFPIPELAGEPFPCGGTVEGARLVSIIWQNQFQGRYGAVVPSAAGWVPGIATLATMKYAMAEADAQVLSFEDPMVAPVLVRGALEDARQSGFRFRGVIEAIPPGTSLEDLVAERPIAASGAIALALQIGAVARRAHAHGHPLTAIRPELIYASMIAGQPELTGIQHCAPTLRAATYAGEAILLPPLFEKDFRSADDVSGLAQLVWYMTTRTHPELAPDDLRWQASWNEFRHEARRRQPWTGPAELGRVLEGALFPTGPRPTLESFMADLEDLRGAH